MTNKKRDHKAVIEEYEKDKWNTVSNIIDKVISSGENTLSRVISLVINELRKVSCDKELNVIFNGKEPVLIPATFAYGGNQSYISSKLLSYCDRDDLTIIDIGSGYGRNLFWLWLHGGPRNARYVALEITDMGRKCSDKLASLDPNMNFDSFYFDFNNPDLSSIVKDSSNILFFTCHAIEQIPQLKVEFFNELLQAGKNIRCIHFEPIGWQIEVDSPEKNIQGSDETYAVKNDYNRNLWELLKLLQQEKKIDIDEVMPEIMGINSANSTSIVSWKKYDSK